MLGFKEETEKEEEFTLMNMLERWHFDVNFEGVDRKLMGIDAKVDGWGVKLVQPVSHRNHRSRTLVVPMALQRYKWNSPEKMRNPVHIPVNIDFSRFIADDCTGTGLYSLRLKSIVVHRGDYRNSGHYISYTYDVATGWTRWDDLNNPGKVDLCPPREKDQLPKYTVWRLEILNDSYLVFYELLRGDGNVAPKDALDSMMSEQFTDRHKDMWRNY